MLTCVALYQYAIINRQAYSLLFQLSKQRLEGQPYSQVIVGVRTSVAGLLATNTSRMSLREVFENNSPDAAEPDTGSWSDLSHCLICL